MNRKYYRITRFTEEGETHISVENTINSNMEDGYWESGLLWKPKAENLKRIIKPTEKQRS
jgi:hypothetical protein